MKLVGEDQRILDSFSAPTKTQDLSTGGVVGAGVNYALGFAYDQAVKLAESEGAKYAAEYETRVSGSDFYTLSKTNNAYSVRGKDSLILTRKASKIRDREAETNLVLVADFEYSPLGDAMFITPKLFQYKASKAKVVDSFLNPLVELFTKKYTRNLDVGIEMEFHHAYVQEGVFKKESLGVIQFSLQDIDVKDLPVTVKGDQLDMQKVGPIAIPAYSRKRLLEGIRRGVPIQAVGNYQIVAKVTEGNDLGSPLMDGAKKLAEKKESNLGSIKAMLGLEEGAESKASTEPKPPPGGNDGVN